MTHKQLSLLLLIAIGTLLEAKPLFPNSVVSNDLEFIRTDDPSVPFEIKATGKSRKEMPDKRSEELFVEGALTFTLNYQDQANFEIWAAPALAQDGAAERYAKLIGKALGKLPAPLRETLSHVVLHTGDEVAFAEEEGHFFVLYSQNIEKRIKTHDLEETIFHEMMHATLEAAHANHPAWLKAQKDDPGFITDYAAKLPKKEDFPESALFAYTLIKTPDRLPAKVQTAIRKTMPHRLKYFQNLFKSLDHPTKK